MERNKIYCQICNNHISEFHCSKCVNKTCNLYKSEIKKYELNIKKTVDNVRKLEKNNKSIYNVKNNLENQVNEYEKKIQIKKELIKKKQEIINKKKKELEIRRQNLLLLNEKLKLKQEKYIDKDISFDKNSPKNNDGKIENLTDNSNKRKFNNSKENGNNESKINKKEEKVKKENIINNKEIENGIFMNSDNIKNLIRHSYLRNYELLNNELMRARQILIRELSKIFKLQKITGFQHGNSNGSTNSMGNYNASFNPPSNNISSFLNNSISQVLHDSSISKIFGTSETETKLNNSIYKNPNFSLFEDIAPPQESTYLKSKPYPSNLSRENNFTTISKTMPSRIKSSNLYNRNVMTNQSSYKNVKAKVKNIPETYTILGYIFPPLNEIWNYSHEYINTSIEYIIQYVILLSYYLDVKLPFSLHYQGIRSYVECHLFNCTCYLPLCYTEKTIEEFLTGLSMLYYDIIYLCYTQGVKLQEENILNILENIYKCTKSPFLGQTLNSNIEFHQHTINFSMLPNSYYYIPKQKLKQDILFNSEIFKRKVPFTILNNTLGNSFNLRFSEIVKLIFLHANVQIPINDNYKKINSINETSINKIEASSPLSNANSSSMPLYENKYPTASSIEWNDINLSYTIETMTLKNEEMSLNDNSHHKYTDRITNTNKKIKTKLSFNTIIPKRKGSNGNSLNNISENNSTTMNSNYNSISYFSNDDIMIDDPSRNNNIFNYEDVMGAEEQIRKQRLTEFLSCIFHDYFSNTNTDEWVLINQETNPPY